MTQEHEEGCPYQDLSIGQACEQYANARRSEEITALREAAAIYREIGDGLGEHQAREGLAASLFSLDRELTSARRFDEAITVFREAAAFFRGSATCPASTTRWTTSPTA